MCCATKAPVIATMFSKGNIKINCQGIGWEGVDWIRGLSICTDVRPCECLKCEKFID